MARKTLEVEKMRTWANNMLAGDWNSRDYKADVCTLIESILMESGNYKGFRFLSDAEEAATLKPTDTAYYQRYYY